MRILLALSVAAWLLGGMQTDVFAQAQPSGKPKSGAATPSIDNLQSNLSLGVGVICDTPEQIKRYLTLYQGSATAEQAATTVNTETNSPGGCGMVSIAFISGDILGDVNVKGGIMRMMRIVVFAMKTEQGWQSIPPTLQYTALFIKLDEA